MSTSAPARPQEGDAFASERQPERGIRSAREVRGQQVAGPAESEHDDESEDLLDGSHDQVSLRRSSAVQVAPPSSRA